MAVLIEHVELSNLEASSYLPRLDLDCNDFSTLSSPTDCPSLSESFLSNSTAIREGEASRRPSLGSSEVSPGWSSTKSSNGTSPTTPVRSVLGPRFPDVHRLKSEHDFDPGSMYSLAQFGLTDTNAWRERVSMGTSLPHLTSTSTMQLMGVLGMSDQSGLCHEYNHYSQSMSMNPSLSRSIFGIEEMVQASVTAKEEALWSHHVKSPLQTIVPSAAFQPILTSSPLTKHEPSTPFREDRFSNGLLPSSPFGLMSPPVVPSQHDIDDIQYEVADHTILASNFSCYQSPTSSDCWTDSFTPHRRQGRPTMHRRGYERKRHVGPSYKPRPVSDKSGINCDVVIAQNEFVCSFLGCEKRFKRQEHKKRHEKTVHDKDGHHECWVPLCKTKAFTRTDNLKSHLKNTHGKKSASQRNRYVATQDKNSIYYDPDWVGDLTESGLPIFHTKM